MRIEYDIVIKTNVRWIKLLVKTLSHIKSLRKIFT